MDFIVCFPVQDYKYSNGINALIHLAIELIKLGHNVKICPTKSYPNEDKLYYPSLIRRLLRNNNKFQDYLLDIVKPYNISIEYGRLKYDVKKTIVIYPEVVIKNPLYAKNIVRYLGNKDGLLKNTTIKKGEKEFLLSHSSIISSIANHVCFFAYQDPVFNNIGVTPTKDRRLDLFYVGKGSLFVQIKKVENTVEITRTWPPTKKELSILLRNCRFFYTYDSWSNINVEANLCGAIPIFLDNGPWKDEEIDGSEIGAIPRIHIDRFASESIDFDEFTKNQEDLMERVRGCEKEWSNSVKVLVDKITGFYF
jgi:hypothetical protein